jgi:hypothetical protein
MVIHGHRCRGCGNSKSICELRSRPEGSELDVLCSRCGQFLGSLKGVNDDKAKAKVPNL